MVLERNIHRKRRESIAIALRASRLAEEFSNRTETASPIFNPDKGIYNRGRSLAQYEKELGGISNLLTDVSRLANERGETLNILDAGAGSTRAASELQKECPEARVSALTIKHHPLHDTFLGSSNIFISPLETMSRVPANHYHLVTLVQSLSYVHDLETASSSLFRITAPGGILKLSANNENSLMRIKERVAQGAPETPRFKEWLGTYKGTTEIIQSLEEAGFIVVYKRDAVRTRKDITFPFRDIILAIKPTNEPGIDDMRRARDLLNSDLNSRRLEQLLYLDVKELNESAIRTQRAV